MRKPRLSLLALMCAASYSVAHAEDVTSLETIQVEGERFTPSTQVIDMADDTAAPAADAGSLLRDLPGVDGIRMGGKGIDPVIRGQQGNRLNILTDGAYIFGACPNRMDPPTAYMAPELFDRITVIEGMQSVVYGPGGSGGTVLFERITPRFAEGEHARGKAGIGYRDNGNVRSGYADLTAGGTQGFVRVYGNKAEADNYKDGTGTEVRSAYKDDGYGAILGWTPDDNTRLEVSYDGLRERDVLYAGAGMDSPKSDADILRARFSREAMSGPITAVHAEVYQSWVNHLMDNYSLRTPPSPMMMMKAPSTSRTSGGNFKLDMPIAGTTWTVGVDMLNNDKDANRYNVSSGSNVLNSVLWPGVSIYQTGLFAQSGLIPLNKDNGFKIGLRYDYVSADASRANVKPAGMAWSPNQLYTAYYGTTAEKKDENNIGGLLRFEHAVSNGVLYAGYARSVRTADATERYIASNSMTPDGRWVGNPDLRPEKHNQFEAGAKLGRGKLAVNGSVFYDQVQDFILRDRFHSTDPTLGNATIYRNVGAQLYGTNLGAVWKPVRGWKAGFNMSYVAATNTDDNRPIAQIPPLGGDVSLEYRPGRWYAGGKMIWNATQTRVDDNPNTGSGLDVGQTPGWSIMNVYGGVAVTRHVMARAGIDNLFNRNYANHLNKASAFDVTQVQVNEPGRVAWVRLSAQF